MDCSSDFTWWCSHRAPKSFAIRYRCAGQPRKLTLGAFPALSLEVARDLGGRALRAAAEGRDPATEKQVAKKGRCESRG